MTQFAFNMPLVKFLAEAQGERLALVQRIGGALEEAGIDAGLMSEHPAPSAEWLRTDPAAHDSLDPLTALAFVAAATSRLRLMTNVVVLPYRNPFLTAKAAATLQILSDDRLLLGVGVGYQREEFEALGVRYEERGALTDEAIDTIRAAWAGGPVVKRGRHFNAVGNEPRPVPVPPPPIWVGGGSDRAVERAARVGDGWAPFFSVPTSDASVMRASVVSMEHFGEKVRRLHDLREQHGCQGPFDIAVAPPSRPGGMSESDARRFQDEVGELQRLGATWIWTSLPARSLSHYLELVQWYGRTVSACR
ncbi:MAG: TIGR03619 family F420-dependent LLM class oxidoreductase [Novosphingobium sp.]